MWKSLSWERVRGDEKWQATCTTQMTTAAHKVEKCSRKGVQIIGNHLKDVPGGVRACAACICGLKGPA
jgi:hypothetical protein